MAYIGSGVVQTRLRALITIRGAHDVVVQVRNYGISAECDQSDRDLRNSDKRQRVVRGRPQQFARSPAVITSHFKTFWT